MFFAKKKIKLSFILAFLDQIYPLTNPLYVINFSKKTTPDLRKKISFTFLIEKKITIELDKMLS